MWRVVCGKLEWGYEKDFIVCEIQIFFKNFEWA